MTVWWDERNGVIVVTLPLPAGVDEAVTPNEDDTHTVFLNENRPRSIRIRAYNHALGHIQRGDFGSCESVQVIEARAHGGGQREF